MFLLNDTATTEIYTLSLHDALPIYGHQQLERPMRQRFVVGERHHRRDRDAVVGSERRAVRSQPLAVTQQAEDRKSTRLNSSHANISYAVFCLKKKIPSTLITTPALS